jgi:hypothetical protein
MKYGIAKNDQPVMVPPVIEVWKRILLAFCTAAAAGCVIHQHPKYLYASIWATISVLLFQWVSWNESQYDRYIASTHQYLVERNVNLSKRVLALECKVKLYERK